MGKAIILTKSTSDLFEKIMDYPNDDVEGLLKIANISPKEMLYLIDKNWGRDDDEVKKIAIELEDIIRKKSEGLEFTRKKKIRNICMNSVKYTYQGKLIRSPRLHQSFNYRRIKLFFGDDSILITREILVGIIESSFSEDIRKMFLKRIYKIDDAEKQKRLLAEIKGIPSLLIKNNLIKNVKSVSTRHFNSIFEDSAKTFYVPSYISSYDLARKDCTKYEYTIERYIDSISFYCINRLLKEDYLKDESDLKRDFIKKSNKNSAKKD